MSRSLLLYCAASVGRPCSLGLSEAAVICCRKRTRSLIVCRTSAKGGLLEARLASMLLLNSAWARHRRPLFCESEEVESVTKGRASHQRAFRGDDEDFWRTMAHDFSILKVCNSAHDASQHQFELTCAGSMLAERVVSGFPEVSRNALHASICTLG